MKSEADTAAARPSPTRPIRIFVATSFPARWRRAPSLRFKLAIDVLTKRYNVGLIPLREALVKLTGLPGILHQHQSAIE